MSRVFIGLDPGTTTGWFELHPNLTTFYAQLKKNEVELALSMRLSNFSEVTVTYESYIITNETAKKSPETGAQDTIGVIKNTCKKFNCILIPQAPAEKKRVPNKMLKDLGLWVPNKRHAMDGARHLLTTVADRDPVLFGKLVDRA